MTTAECRSLDIRKLPRPGTWTPAADVHEDCVIVDGVVLATEKIAQRPGGYRRWFRCPIDPTHRAAILYWQNHAWGCRRHPRLIYHSTLQGLRDNARDKAQAIRVKLGGSPDLAAVFPPRPRGMLRRIYAALLAKAMAAEQTARAGIAATLNRWLERRGVPPGSGVAGVETASMMCASARHVERLTGGSRQCPKQAAQREV